MDALRTFYVVRHAKAGDRDAWTGDDRKRPLTGKGRTQADRLVEQLSSLRISAIYSSSYVRCVQTVEPLARARRLELELSPSLEEGHGLEGLIEFFVDRSMGDTVLSTHGDVTYELVEDLVEREVVQGSDAAYEKGSTWVIGVDEHGVPVQARYLPAP